MQPGPDRLALAQQLPDDGDGAGLVDLEAVEAHAAFGSDDHRPRSTTGPVEPYHRRLSTRGVYVVAYRNVSEPVLFHGSHGALSRVDVAALEHGLDRHERHPVVAYPLADSGHRRETMAVTAQTPALEAVQVDGADVAQAQLPPVVR